MQVKPKLSTLPVHIIKVNKRWYKNIHNGVWIPANRITEHLPDTKATQNAEDILKKRWDLNY